MFRNGSASMRSLAWKTVCAAAVACSTAGCVEPAVQPTTASANEPPPAGNGTAHNCFLALEGEGWTPWKAPDPDAFPTIEARAFCQQGGPEHGSYKFQWRTSDTTQLIEWNYSTSALRQDQETYTTRFPRQRGQATQPQRVDYECRAKVSPELCVDIVSWLEGADEQ